MVFGVGCLGPCWLWVWMVRVSNTLKAGFWLSVPGKGLGYRFSGGRSARPSMLCRIMYGYL